MPAKRRIPRRSEDELIHWLAANGQNYEMFLKFWEKQGWATKPFTKEYLKRWAWKRLDRIQAARAEHKSKLMQEILMNKERRIQILTDSVQRIQAALDKMFESAPHVCPTCGEDHITMSVKDYLMLEDQLRKTMESLAKEYGEYNRPNEQTQRVLATDLHAQLLAAAKDIKGLLREQTYVVDGEVNETGDA